MELSENDIKKLKYERRIGYVFMIIIYTFGGLFNLMCYIMEEINLSLIVLIFINFGIILLGILVAVLINRDVNKDLKSNDKIVSVKKIIEKHTEKSYEAGSGSLYIPVLGDIFPKLWRQEMRETTKYFIVTETYKHEVEKHEYEMFEIGETILVHYGKISGIVLCYSKEDIKNSNEVV